MVLRQMIDQIRDAVLHSARVEPVNDMCNQGDGSISDPTDFDIRVEMM